MAEPKFSTGNNAWRSSSTGADIAVASSLASLPSTSRSNSVSPFASASFIFVDKSSSFLADSSEFVSGAVEFRLRIAKLFGNRASRTRKRARRIIEFGSTRRKQRRRVGHRAHEVVEVWLHVIVVLVFSVLHLLFCFGDLRIDVVARNLGARNAIFQIARPWCRAGERDAPWSCSRHAGCLPFV